MTVIKPKRTDAAGKVPTTSDLADGEIAVNRADRKLYIRAGANVIELGSTTEARHYDGGAASSVYTIDQHSFDGGSANG